MPENEEKLESGMYAGIAAILIIMCAFGEGIYEIYHWLRYGFKAGLTAANVMTDHMNIDLTSIYYPTEWVGAAKIAEYILEADLWFFLMGIGGLFMWYALAREP
jgi:hypothetical protein